MQAIQNQVAALTTNWNPVFKTLEKNPQVAAAYLQGISADQINEVIETLADLLRRTRAPAGFNPGFHLAKSVAATALAGANSSLVPIRQGQYNHLPGFVIGLNQATTALYTCLLRSESQNAGDQIDHELVEKISLLNTAQTELGRKLDSLRAATDLLAEIQIGHQKIEATSKDAGEKLEEIEGLKNDSKETLEELVEYEKKYTQLTIKSSEALARVQTIEEDLKAKRKLLSDLQTESINQKDLINALLPEAASVGLASAFSIRVREMEKSKRLWLYGFIIAIGFLLIIGAITIVQTAIAMDINIFSLLLRRVPLVAPLVWLGWFSAVQYGNSLRVQEDYAFKEATSKAFEGYRDHMEHLKGIEIAEAESALTLLSKSTIEILSKEPLRVFKGTHRDATPANALQDMMKR